MNSKPVIACLDKVLKPMGFVRHKATWNRKAGRFVDVIELQRSKSGDTITINAGVAHPEVHRKCWSAELPRVVQDPDCTVRARIGELIDGKDLWWQLTGEGVEDHVVRKVTTHVLPFLDEMHSPQAMLQFLTAVPVSKQRYPPPVIYLAILKHELGDRVGACTLLTALGKRIVGGWRSRVAEVARALGCG